MAFSIQTNVNSLVAQENLRVNSNFQSQTIQRLTSGYRINTSGDDAAGLAIANKFRSDTAELAQGVRNANDGVAQLQIMDGGMNNIGKMLDRLKTLATQSSSGTFTGDRSVLNSEYQSLINEIDRQAQGIGLSTGGRFAAKMGVYVGGGTTASGTADTANGTIDLDLSNSVVDTKALGLRTSDFEVETTPGTDIGPGSSTSVAAIASANSTDAGLASFRLSGPGFAGVQLNVNITGLSTPQQVADQMNAVISAAGNSDTSFRAAGITATVNTASDGTQQLVFTSTASAFQVQAGTATANGLLGNFKTGANTPGTGADVKGSFTGGAMTRATADENGATPVKLQVTLDGVVHTFTVNIANNDDAAGTGAGTLFNDVNTAVDNGGKTLSGLGITLANDTGNKLKFVGPAGTSMQIAVAGDQANFLGLGSWQGDFAKSSYATGTGTAVLGVGTGILELSIDGGNKIAIQLSDTSSLDNITQSITNAVRNNATLQAAGITASNDPTHITISSNGTDFRVNTLFSNPLVDLQLDSATNLVGTQTASLASMDVLPAQGSRIEASGSAQTGLGATNDVFSFSGLVNRGDQQALSFSTIDSAGAPEATSITLTTANAATLDDAIRNINAQLQSGPTLKKIVAVKEMNSSGTAEGIRFVSSVSSFSVKVGNAANFTDTNPVGLYDGTGGATAKQGMTVDSSASGSMDITTITGAQQAVVALGEAVTRLGTAQSALGKGQNQLGYAISLANSQISNFSAAQSQIRDADVAAEAANLSKAQVLQQASIAAMAQANSAPQAVLSLLKG